MASTAQNKTPVYSHPLSPDDVPSKSRRNRLNPASDARPVSSASNYFTLKAQLEQNNLDSPNWDGSVRGYGKAEKMKSLEPNSSPSLTNMWDRSPKAAPLFIVGSQGDRALAHAPPEVVVTAEPELDGVSPAMSAHVLATKWHTYSDEAIQASIAKLSASDSPADAPSQPYHTALRVLSSAVNNLSRARLELEEGRRLLLEKELARRKRAEDLLKELKPSEQDVAKRVIQSLFTDDDELVHRVHRKQSVLVCSFSYYLHNIRRSYCHTSRWQNLLPKPLQTKAWYLAACQINHTSYHPCLRSHQRPHLKHKHCSKKNWQSPQKSKSYRLLRQTLQLQQRWPKMTLQESPH